MSILTFLFFTSCVYFVTADPIAESTVESALVDQVLLSAQEPMNNFMTAVEKAYDEYFAPLLSNLNEDDCEYLKMTTLDGIGSYMNFCLYRAIQQYDSETFSQTVEDDIVLKFDSSDSWTSAAYQRPPTPCQAA